MLCQILPSYILPIPNPPPIPLGTTATICLFPNVQRTPALSRRRGTIHRGSGSPLLQGGFAPPTASPCAGCRKEKALRGTAAAARLQRVFDKSKTPSNEWTAPQFPTLRRPRTSTSTVADQGITLFEGHWVQTQIAKLFRIGSPCPPIPQQTLQDPKNHHSAMAGCQNPQLELVMPRAVSAHTARRTYPHTGISPAGISGASASRCAQQESKPKGNTRS